MKIYFRYLIIQIKSLMEYKTSFILTVFGQFLVSMFFLAGMYFLFDRFGNIKGYTFSEVLLCFSTIFISFSIAETIGRGFDKFSSIISNGEFDRIMLRPISAIIQVLGSRIEFSRIGRLFQAILVLVYSINTSEVHWTLLKILTLIFMVIGGVCIFLGLFLIYASICFYSIQVLEIINIFTDGGREICQYPLSIYEKWVLKFFTFIVPLAFVNYHPYLYIIGKVKNIYYVFSPLIGILFLIPAYILWRIGIRHYKSTGS